MLEGLQSASLQRRALARLVDAFVVLVLGAGAIAAGAVAAAAYDRIRGNHDLADGEILDTSSQFRLPAWARGALWVSAAGLGVVTRNWRTPGFRLLRLRRVDAHTGGPVSVPSALTGQVFELAWGATTRPLIRPNLRREQERLRAFGPQLQEIQRKHAADTEARQQALTQFYKAHALNPLTSCARPLLLGMTSRAALGLVYGRGQTIQDRLTGTAVVVDP